MKLALTLEADSVNVQALNMGRIVVDVDGVNLAELINVVCDNGHSLRVFDNCDRPPKAATPPLSPLPGNRWRPPKPGKKQPRGAPRCATK
ncbi:DUF5983 family protein, partial [Escherichia coli]